MFSTLILLTFLACGSNAQNATGVKHLRQMQATSGKLPGCRYIVRDTTRGFSHRHTMALLVIHGKTEFVQPPSTHHSPVALGLMRVFGSARMVKAESSVRMASRTVLRVTTPL